MNNKELHYFIGSCLALDQNPDLKEIIKLQIQENSINWNSFVRICSNNLILQTIWVKFRDHGLIGQIPIELASYLEEIYNLNLNRNIQIINQIDQLTKDFNSQNIQPIYLKGAGNIIDNLYGDIGDRLLSDIDLLVPEEHFLPAAKYLESKGYRTFQTPYESISEQMHYPTLHKDDGSVPVEIHRSPVMLEWTGELNNVTVSADKKAIPDRPGCFVPSDEHKFMINFIHSQLSNQGNITGLVSFRDLYDSFLIQDRIDLNFLLPKMQYRKRASSYLLLSDRLFRIKREQKFPNSYLSRIFLMHYNLNLSCRLYYHFFRIIRSFWELLIIHYLGTITGIIFRRNFRKTVFRKLSSKVWYKSHLLSFSERFK